MRRQNTEFDILWRELNQSRGQGPLDNKDIIKQADHLINYMKLHGGDTRFLIDAYFYKGQAQKQLGLPAEAEKSLGTALQLTNSISKYFSTTYKAEIKQ